MPEDLNKMKTEDYYSNLFKEIDIKNFLKKPIREVVKLAQAPTIDIPPVIEKADEAEGGDQPLVDMPQAPMEPADLPPLPTPPISENLVEPQLSDKDRETMKDDLDDVQDSLQSIKNDLMYIKMKEQIMEEVKDYYKDLRKELESLKSRKIPERKFFDTEGAYRDSLYSIATNILDEILPELFEEIPDYQFTAVQVSRVFEDGTVADAMVSLMAVVPHNGMRYDFKIDMPVLNGLMQYPMYIQRGAKVVPLTKPEIQKELDSISYRKVDVETPYEKDNIFNNIGENIHRRPDKQKWYDVKPNMHKQVTLPANHKYIPQRGLNLNEKR
jgi:hypothetical protein